jgi:hypothetical protein
MIVQKNWKEWGMKMILIFCIYTYNTLFFKKRNYVFGRNYLNNLKDLLDFF